MTNTNLHIRAMLQELLKHCQHLLQLQLDKLLNPREFEQTPVNTFHCKCLLIRCLTDSINIKRNNWKAKTGRRVE